MWMKSTFLLCAIALVLVEAGTINKSKNFNNDLSSHAARQSISQSQPNILKRNKRNTDEARDILDFWKKKENELGDAKDPNIILVLGNSGIGKSTFVQVLASNNSNVSNIDETEIPNRIIDAQTNMVFYDCPEFTDTRDVKHDIVGTYLIEKIVKNAEAMKFVFVVDYSSVKQGTDKSKFSQFTKQATSMILNINKFENGIAMVVYIVDDDKQDEMILHTVVDFLQEIKIEINKKETKTSVEQQAIQFVDTLLTKNGENYPRIGLLRVPENISAMQDAKKNLTNLILNNIQYVKHDYAEDFRFTISAESKDYIQNDLVGEISNKISSSSNKIVETLTEYYNSSVKNIINKIGSFVSNVEVTVSDTDISEAKSILTKLSTGRSTILTLKEEINYSMTAEELARKIDASIATLNVTISQNDISDISIQGKYLEYLKTVADFEDLYYSDDVKIFLQGLVLTLDTFKTLIYDITYDKENEINNLIKSKIEYCGKQIHNYFIHQEETVFNFTNLSHEMDSYVELSKTFNTANNPNKCVEKFRNIIQHLNYSHPDLIFASQILSNSTKYIGYLQFIELIINQQSTHSFKCAKGLKNEYLQDSRKWYNFLENLSDTILKNNATQRIKPHDIINLVIAEKNENKKVFQTDFKEKSQKFYQNTNLFNLEYRKIGNLTLNILKIKSLERFSAETYNYILTYLPWSFDNNTDNKNSSINDLYDTSGFVSELNGLESQYRELHNKISFLPYYKSIFERINRYELKIKNTSIYDDNKKVLNYLKLATWTRVHNIENNEETYLVVDVDGYFTLVQGHINEYKNALKEVKIDNYNRQYERNTNSLINQTNNFVKYDVLPTINNIIKETDEKIGSLIKEVSNLIKNAKDEKEELKQTKKKLEGQLFARGVLGVVSVASAALAFAGPYGAAAAAVLDTGSSVAEYVLNNKIIHDKTKITELPASIQNTITQVLDSLKEKQNTFMDRLVDVEGQLDDFLSEYSSEHLLQLQEKISKAKQKFEREVAQSTILSRESLDQIKNLSNEVTEAIGLEQKRITQEKLDANSPERQKIERELSELRKELNEEEGTSSASLYRIVELSKNITRLEESIADPAIRDEKELEKKLSAVEQEIQKEKANGMNEKKLKRLEVEKKELLDKKEFAINVIKINNEILELQNEIKKETMKNGRTKRSLDEKSSKWNKIKELINDKALIIQKENDKTNEKTEKTFTTINNIKNTAKVVGVAFNALKKYLSFTDGIANINNELNLEDAKIEKLQEYEESIYKIILPMANSMQGLAEIISGNLTNQSHAAIDITEWKVQSTIRDIKFQIEEMTGGFQAQSSIQHYLDKFQYGMEILIKMYDRIADAKDKQTLADYIANINSDVKVSNNTELNRNIHALELMIKSNIVIQEYDQAINAFKQFIFPFMDEYRGVVESDALNSSINDLIDNAVTKITFLKDTILKEKVLINPNIDKDIFPKSIFDNGESNNGAFFVWGHDSYENEISRLLRGEKIIVEADIAKGLVDFNAVKFNNIGVNFKLLNATLQQNLDEELKSFSIEMTHLGESHYKCGDKFYTITHDHQKMAHSVLSTDGKYGNPNALYDKISNNLPILSPYTMWKIKLVPRHAHRETAFNNFIKYTNQSINLELVGSGYYVSSDARVCQNSDNSLMYYVAIADKNNSGK